LALFCYINHTHGNNIKNTIKFITKNSSHSALCIGFKEKDREGTINTTFLGVEIDKHLNWKYHIKRTISKLRGACYALRSMVISVTLTLSNQFTINIFIVINTNYFFWVTLPSVGRCSLYKRKLSELWVCGHSLFGVAGSNPALGGGGPGCLSHVSVVCCTVEVSASG
jgi:hypothetical protein